MLGAREKLENHDFLRELVFFLLFEHMMQTG